MYHVTYFHSAVNRAVACIPLVCRYKQIEIKIRFKYSKNWIWKVIPSCLLDTNKHVIFGRRKIQLLYKAEKTTKRHFEVKNFPSISLGGTPDLTYFSVLQIVSLSLKNMKTMTSTVPILFTFSNLRNDLVDRKWIKFKETTFKTTASKE